MTLTYERAVAQLKSRATKKLACNTYLRRLDPCTLVIRLHSTDIIYLHDDGTYTLDAGSWQTVTTKARMIEYTPAHIHCDKGVWYIGETSFANGIKIAADGSVLSGGQDLANDRLLSNRLNKMIRKYINGFAASVAEARELRLPDNADCWGCLFTPANPQPNDPHKGLEGMGLDHLLSHFEDNYYVPSLLFKACKLKAGNPSFVYQLMVDEAKRGEVGWLKRMLSGYFRARKPHLLKLLREQVPV